MVSKQIISFTKRFSIILFITLTVACTQELETLQTTPKNQANSSRISALYASRSINFTRVNGSYILKDATNDLGDIIGTWQSQNIGVYSNQLRIRIPANSISGQPSPSGSGNIVNIDVPDGSEYEISYKVRFDPTFQWSLGGKVGFGFLIGDGNAGGDKADDGNGASIRLTWYNPTNQKNGTGTDSPYLKPHLYYKDMPGKYGNDFGIKSKILKKNTWYTIKIRVKSNTGSNYNGSVFFSIDGVTLFSKNDIRWTTNTAKRLIRHISFHTFRGGNQEHWGSTTDGLIYYDDVTWKRLAN